MTKRTYDQRGIVSLGTTLVIFTAALAIAISVQFLGIGELILSRGTQESEQAFQAADSCTDEALLRLSRDNSYTGGTLSVGSGSCTITVSGGGGTRTISVSATVGTSIRKITVDVTVSGYDVIITSWAEDIT